MLMVFLGIIIGMIIVMIFDIIKKRSDEKQYFNEYKEILKEYYKSNEDVKKKEFK